MNSFIHTLSDTVLSKGFESFDLEALKALSLTHPYSSAIQLLYTQKLKQADSVDYHEQLQKALLYYSNPLFVKHLIEAEDRVFFFPKPEDTGSTATSSSDAPAETFTVIDDHKEIDVHVTKPANSSVETIDLTEIPDAPEKTTVAESEPVPEKHLTREETFFIKEDETDEDPEPEDHEDEASLPPLPEFKFEPIDPAKAELAFMPYHTVDYFAAQGIKLGDENRTGDRFGTQLKSFTAWLKQMKRLPGATAKGNITVSEEKSIEQMAEQSLSGENADTEAMAQVWAKQGNSKKAIEIYKKLSLQIPAKSAYFAAKIDYLKK